MPFSTPLDAPGLGIDAGATLCKIAHFDGNMLVTRALPSGEIDAIRDYIAARPALRLVVTGGGARPLADALSTTGAEISHIGEFEAWLRGAAPLAAHEGCTLPERYLLVSLGTGTSILLASQAKGQRVGGSALGGGTLLGLGELLLGTRRFSEIAQLAARGDRRRVDLLVGDIYPAQGAPLPADLNAASFAKLGSREPADLGHALMAMIGENVGLICSSLATLHGADTILYCGSTVRDENPTLREVLRGIGAAFGHSARFLQQGAFGAALGAALMPDPRRDAPVE